MPEEQHLDKTTTNEMAKTNPFRPTAHFFLENWGQILVDRVGIWGKSRLVKYFTLFLFLPLDHARRIPSPNATVFCWCLQALPGRTTNAFAAVVAPSLHLGQMFLFFMCMMSLIWKLYQHPPRGGVRTLRSCSMTPFTIHLAPLGGSRYKYPNQTHRFFLVENGEFQEVLTHRIHETNGMCFHFWWYMYITCR